MITKQLEYIIKTYNIEKTYNIIYGTNIPMPNKMIVTPKGIKLRFDESEYYFFYFDEEGITIYPRDGSLCAVIPWSIVTDFKISHVSIIGKMTIKTNDNVYNFQLNRFVFGCPWIKTNTKYLESNNYFYKK